MEVVESTCLLLHGSATAAESLLPRTIGADMDQPVSKALAHASLTERGFICIQFATFLREALPSNRSCSAIVIVFGSGLSHSLSSPHMISPVVQPGKARAQGSCGGEVSNETFRLT